MVFYDQRGTGKSDRFPIENSSSPGLEKLSVQENVKDLDALRKWFGVDKVALIGHSWGGALVTFYAVENPENVAKLIVYSGGPEDVELADLKSRKHLSRLTNQERSLLEEKKTELSTALVSGESNQQELDEILADLIELMFPSLYCKRPIQPPEFQGRAGFWANQVAGKYVDTFDREDFYQRLSRVTAETLLIWGRCEPSPRERLTNMLRHLPNAKFITFEHSGHNALDEESDLFLVTVRRFLGEL